MTLDDDIVVEDDDESEAARHERQQMQQAIDESLLIAKSLEEIDDDVAKEFAHGIMDANDDDVVEVVVDKAPNTKQQPPSPAPIDDQPKPHIYRLRSAVHHFGKSATGGWSTHHFNIERC